MPTPIPADFSAPSIKISAFEGDSDNEEAFFSTKDDLENSARKTSSKGNISFLKANKEEGMDSLSYRTPDASDHTSSLADVDDQNLETDEEAGAQRTPSPIDEVAKVSAGKPPLPRPRGLSFLPRSNSGEDKSSENTSPKSANR